MNRKQIAASAAGAVLTLTLLVGREFLATSGKGVAVLPLRNGEYLAVAEIRYPVWSVVLLWLVVLGTVAAVVMLPDRNHS